MNASARRFFDHVYEQARGPDELPWHRDTPPTLLTRVVAERAKAGKAGRALDVGCGSGVFSAWLAGQGYDVTGIDFSEAAIAMARETAQRAGVTVNLVRADVLAWPNPEQFDLVFDWGCLHGLRGEARRRYRDRLLSWLAPGGDYVLGHFDRRHPLDWRPIGPRRVPPARILALFVPPLVERARDAETHHAAFPIGPTVRVAIYWFGRDAGVTPGTASPGTSAAATRHPRP
jgi:SAM-dependent methyltransferase